MGWYLKPVKTFANYHDDECSKQEESQDEKEPEEPLGIVTEITAVIFLVSFLNPPAFFDKHIVDLPDMLLHLGKHPLVLLVK